MTELKLFSLWKVQPENKFISLGSLFSEDVAYYFQLYKIATAKWNYGFLFNGGYPEQPAIVYEAFNYIDSIYGEQERKQNQKIIRERNQQALLDKAKNG